MSSALILGGGRALCKALTALLVCIESDDEYIVGLGQNEF